MDVMQFITKEFIWLVPCLMIIGGIIKNIPNIPNWVIPLITLALGIILGGFYGSWTTGAIMQGFICGLASTGTHQVLKQTICNSKAKEE